MPTPPDACPNCNHAGELLTYTEAPATRNFPPQFLRWCEHCHAITEMTAAEYARLLRETATPPDHLDRAHRLLAAAHVAAADAWLAARREQDYRDAIEACLLAESAPR